MKIKTKKILVYVVAIAILFSMHIETAYAFGDKIDKMREHREKAMDSMIEKLDLTPEQQKKIDRQRKTQRKKREQLKTKLRAEMEALKKELDKSKVDRRKVDRLIDKIADLRGKMMKERVNGILAMRETLTQEQQDKLKEQMELRKKEFHKKRKKRHYF